MKTFSAVEADRHGGAAGWVDTMFYSDVDEYLASTDAPLEVRTSVDLVHAVRGLDFGAAAAAADGLGLTGARTQLLPASLLLDGAIVAYLAVGRRDAARAAFEALAPMTGRGPEHARNLLLRALVGATPDP